MFASSVQIIGGIILLFWGAEWLLYSSVQFALRFRISPLIIGLTLISFVTSLPEAVTSVFAQIQGVSSDVALGNVVGSNIANIGLVLGVGVLLAPIEVPKKVVRIEMPILMILSLVLWGLMFFGQLGRGIGLAFLLGFMIYSVLELKWGKGNLKELPSAKGKLWQHIFYFILGVIFLGSGAKYLVTGGVEWAHLLHVPERIIAVSVIAVGTSLPELALVILAGIHKKETVILGNVIGSNILNILFIVGISALIRPLLFSSQILHFDVPVMLGFTALLWIVLAFRPQLSRLFGGALLLLYVVYLTLVI